MLGGAVEFGGRLEWFERACHGGLPGSRQQRVEPILSKRLECPRRLECLVQALHGIASVNDYRGRQIQRVVETLDRCGNARFQDVAEGDRFHAKDGGALFDKSWDNLMGEAAEVKIEYVQGHLAGIEMELMLGCDVEHTQVNGRVLMAGEADVTDLAGFLRSHHGFVCAAGREVSVGIFHPEMLVELNEVDDLHLHAPQ